MSDNAIIGAVMGAFGVLTWLLGLSYFLGRNTAKLDGLADAQEKLAQTIRKIFEKLDELVRSMPHVCDKAERIARLEMLAQERSHRLQALEEWRNDEAFRAPHPQRDPDQRADK